ncbi:MAG TPA: DNA mismatch repair protein MutS, partial [Saprospiraceae bacterium]|nr:DNA mismatch repair protein MutS [Saprospiraceae bacterium]
KSIVDRHNAVRYLVQEANLREELLSALNGFGDLERLVAKLPMHKINPREFKAVGKALEKIQKIIVLLCHTSDSLLLESVNALDGCANLLRNIEFALESDAPVVINKGGIFKPGYNRELDDLKYILTNSKDLLLEIQKEESLRTGITNLKIGYNSVFGYYLEVTNKYKNQDIIPPDWIRKQTMSTGERYITSRLKELEDKILGAEEKIISLEEELYKELIESAQAYLLPLQKNARTVALLDCLLGFAIQAEQFQYIQPEITDGDSIMIEGGRHPVIERMLPTGESFIPNDIFIDRDQQQILMITGPNMSGKSAILRQTALICILAQAGSFVPCNKAILGIHDRLFTRVGASDNISSGESTFMVEMNETSAILNNLSSRSLVLLDEIGRGTSTYDGISIAWSIACYLHNSPLRPKTLFATHYHELNELGEELPRVKNFHVATKESGKNVIFLRKLLEGGSEHSFGIHVAQMAGMPEAIISSARQKLAELESARQHHDGKAEGLNLKVLKINNTSLMEEEILNLNTEAISPIEALIKLNELQERLRRRLDEE